jgi:4,5-DOPA dioxygenase extradiol
MPDAARWPVVFLGHGNPMNAVTRNAWTGAWGALGRSLDASHGRPRAVLAISAHWYVPGTAVTTMARPRTIHDFGGFPRELFEVQYPAPGAPDVAARVRELLVPTPVDADTRWGLDHGTWSVLAHVYPQADVPVVQLAIDETLTAHEHVELARRLAPLRDEGVLVLGSGNVVHNLHAYGWGRHVPEPYDWAQRFEDRVRAALAAGDDTPLVDVESIGPDALLAVPTPDHYLPFLYVLALRGEGERASFPVEGFDGGSISMLAVRFGGEP